MKKYLRFSFVGFWIFLGFLFVFGKLFYLTVFEKTDKKESNPEKIQYMRGFIYSADRTLLAISIKTLSVYANPAQFEESEKEKYLLLFQRLGIDRNKREELLKSKSSFRWLKRFLEKKDFQEILATDLLKLPGIAYIKEYKRYYPQGPSASQIVGFIGYDGDGLAGVEYSMDNRLKASNELLPIWEKENILGNDIILTINMPLQNALKEEIQTAFQDTKAKSISAVVMDPSNGDILAMGNYPDFDPNNFTQYNNYSLFKNNVLSYIDEPGSTFKPLIMAYLLDNQKISEKAKFQCDGKKNLYGFTIRDEKVHGWVDPRKIITYSCNVGMALASQELTRKELYGILKLYGLGKETGINLPGEEKGIIRTPNKMTLRSKISIPIGQEIGIPPMQLVKAYSAIANDGLLISPRIVKKIEYNGKTIEEFPPRTGIKILTQKTADKILSYMRDVVLKGTGREADIPGVWIGGKTGTAQIFDFETRTYSKVNTSFVSIVKDKKGRKYIIYVVIRNPEVEEASGGKLVAPLVKRIAQKLLDIYNK